MTTHTPRRFFRTLYFRVIVGIVLGVLVGIFAPHAGEQLKPLGDVFIKLIRMMITPVIFFTVVIGIGLVTLLSLGKLLLCVYLTSLSFIFIALGLICHSQGISLWKFLKYIREEILIALGTSSSETVLPRMIVKMERLGLLQNRSSDW